MECWEQFDEETVGREDIGIGGYEYGGIKGVDRHVVEVCPICKGTVEQGQLPCCEECGDPLEKLEYHNNRDLCAPCLREGNKDDKTGEDE